MDQNIKSALVWVFGTTRKDALSSLMAILIFCGLALRMIAKADLSSSDLLIGLGQIIGLILTGKSSDLATSGGIK